MKRVLIVALLVLGMAAGANAIDDLLHRGDYEVDGNLYGAKVWYTAVLGYYNASAGCTLSLTDAYAYRDWSMYVRRSKDGNCDSCRLHGYLDRSFDGSNWVLLDTFALAGKVADTLGYIVDWNTTTVEYVDSVTGFPTKYNVKNRPGVYYRIRLLVVAAANCSTYIHSIYVMARQ
jgi:hypothetical protein